MLSIVTETRALEPTLWLQYCTISMFLQNENSTSVYNSRTSFDFKPITRGLGAWSWGGGGGVGGRDHKGEGEKVLGFSDGILPFKSFEYLFL